MTSEPTASAMVLTLTGKPVEARNSERFRHSERVRAQVQRHTDCGNPVGKEFDETARHSREVATVQHLVVAYRFWAFHLDALAVGQHAVERLQRQTRRVRAGPRAS